MKRRGNHASIDAELLYFAKAQEYVERQPKGEPCLLKLRSC